MLKSSSLVAEPDYPNATCGGRVVRLGCGALDLRKGKCSRGQGRAEVLIEVLTDDEDFDEYSDEHLIGASRTYVTADVTTQCSRIAKVADQLPIHRSSRPSPLARSRS